MTTRADDVSTLEAMIREVLRHPSSTPAEHEARDRAAVEERLRALGLHPGTLGAGWADSPIWPTMWPLLDIVFGVLQAHTEALDEVRALVRRELARPARWKANARAETAASAATRGTP